MIVMMSLDEYARLQSLVEAGIDEDLAFQQLVRNYPPELQVEMPIEGESGDISEQPAVKTEDEPTEQISQN